MILLDGTGASSLVGGMGAVRHTQVFHEMCHILFAPIKNALWKQVHYNTKHYALLKGSKSPDSLPTVPTLESSILCHVEVVASNGSMHTRAAPDYSC